MAEEEHIPDDLCPQCRGDLNHHCKAGHPTCKWTTCKRCKLTIDRGAMRMLHGGDPVPWPHSRPA